MAKDSLSRHDYEKELVALQIELVKLHRDIIRYNQKILVLFEGRDAAGKDGTIKRIVEHLSPRETRVVALGKPGERELSTWYFQRFVPHLPAAQEFVLFNRSWYNRAGVERVMGFCSKAESDAFLDMAPRFEAMLVESGIRVFKYYLDISKREQTARLEDRRTNPLKQWKISEVDDVAVKHWADYSMARNLMLERTHTGVAPWRVVRADNKRTARLNVIRDLLHSVEYTGPEKTEKADADIVRLFTPALIEEKWLAP